jgi:6,7-dimethyl-8-ribityllumazine synthase
LSNHIEGSLDGSGLKIGIVAAKFNEFITTKLVEGSQEGLSENGVDATDVTIAYVPGSFEIPVVASKMAHSGNYDAVICLGAVIKGDTDHYEYVAGEATRGIASVSLSSGIPVIFGVLTTHTMQHALERCGGRKGNAGHSCAVTAIETVNVLRAI